MDAVLRNIPIAKIDTTSRFQVRQHAADHADPALPSLTRSLAGPESQIHPRVS